MPPAIPGYIEHRIRRPAPRNAFVVPGSTPVVSFGNAQKASVATLGINPSRVEFLAKDGSELVGNSRRLATHASLGTSDLANAPRSVIAQVLADCNGYFDRNPYRRWFDPLDAILNGIGASYYNGMACHLDLVQWATDPTWGKIQPSKTRKQLIAEDSDFLVEQLENERLELLLVNGRGAFKALQAMTGVSLAEQEPLCGYAHFVCRLFVGTILGKTRVIAWSTNLQSSHGVTNEFRAVLGKRIAALHKRPRAAGASIDSRLPES
jgi:hypothetical protein